MNKKNYHILAIVTLTILITYLHFVTMRNFSELVVLSIVLNLLGVGPMPDQQGLNSSS